ncbi:MAG TPA: S41 family peptidase [Reyranellaceae bacterium]|nr:S41 family peptidase [Reyranellaceae bacterium]
MIERIIAELRKSYVFPEVARAAEAALREAEARGAYAATTSGEDFAERLTADLLAVTKDKHLGVSFSVEPLPPVGAAKAKDPAAMENWRRSAARSNFAIPRVEVLPGNLGYIKMTNFVPVQFAGETFAAAMRFIANTDALILDLRDNWGGDPQMVAFVLSYLVPPSTHLNDFYNRVDGTTTQVWSLPLVPGGAYGTERPVYVLTNSVTISAAEEVAYDLQQLKRGTVVGEKTAGAANPGGSIRINDHFAVFVPVGRAINPISKTNWEGVGVIPDVPANSDQALDVAVRLALKEVAASAVGSPASN